MADQQTVAIGSISLDRNNFRILPQANEEDALKAIVAIHPDWFWALVQSLLVDGYEPTENLLLLKTGKGGKGLVVKEGNRRVAAMKYLLGLLKGDDVPVPGNILTAISTMPPEMKATFNEIPCLVYSPEDAEKLDRIVARVHGKGDKSGRQTWTAVTKARHNRDHNKREECGLDLLETYLKEGKNIQPNQRQQWAGDYRITILNEAMQKLAPKLGLKNPRELVALYQGGAYRPAFEKMLQAIGTENFKFKGLRSDGGPDFGQFGFPSIAVPQGTQPQGGTSPVATGGVSDGNPGTGGAGKLSGEQETGADAGGKGQPCGGANTQAAGARRTNAKATNDPSSVTSKLRTLKPKGENRSKVVTLQKEAIRLSLESDGHPHAFCFLLRSMIELSAKAYCEDHAKDGLSYTTKDGKDMELSKVLAAVINHYTKQGQDEAAKRRIKGATAELGNSHGFLSVHSMNQLIHHPSFTVDGPHIATVFHNIFPFLQVLNE